MAENNFKPFAVGAGANVSSQADWENLVALSTGFTAGVARSEQVNKALRQGTVMASVLGQIIADQTAEDVLDDGDTAALKLSCWPLLPHYKLIPYILLARCFSSLRTKIQTRFSGNHTELHRGK